jgi:alkylated DNA nucleotide flippase Atl1
LQAEIAALKGSNFSKGIVGESLLRSVLGRAFPHFEVVDKSGTVAESDIHLVNSEEGTFIAIESKNKANITIQDVEKSMRDIDYLKQKYGSRFAGYVFVSLRTPSIPKKGTSFEVVHDSIPVAWIGCDPSNESMIYDLICEVLPTIVKVIHCVAKVLGKLAVTSDESDQEVRAFREEVCMFVHNALVRVESNVKVLASLQNSVKTLLDTNNALITDIQRFVTAHNISPKNHCGKVSDSLNKTPDQGGKFAATLLCEGCGVSFKRKCDFSRHAKTCDKRRM